MLVRVGIRNTLDRWRLLQHSLCRFVHCRLHRGGLIRGKDLERGLSRLFVGFLEVYKLVNLADVGNGQRDVWWKLNVVFQINAR